MHAALALQKITDLTSPGGDYAILGLLIVAGLLFVGGATKKSKQK